MSKAARIAITDQLDPPLNPPEPQIPDDDIENGLTKASPTSPISNPSLGASNPPSSGRSSPMEVVSGRSSTTSATPLSNSSQFRSKITTLKVGANFQTPIRGKNIFELDPLDGIEIGEFIIQVLNKKPRKNVKDKIIDEFKGLKDFYNGIKIDGTSGKRNLWLKPLLITIIVNKPFGSWLSVWNYVVSRWYLQSLFLDDLSSNHEWFLPMISLLSHDLVLRAWWGLRGKVVLIFCLNYVNIFLDFYLIFKNLGVVDGGRREEECSTVGGVDEWSLGFAMAITYVIQLFAKLSLNAAQNVESSMTETERFKNFFTAILFLKPVIDVKNIIADTGKGEGQIFEPTMELLAEKQLDLCFGDIPMIFCQLCNLLALSPDCGSANTNILLTSIAVSLAMIGYTQASLTYYGDTDSYLRSRVPNFYGFVPDSVGTRIGMMISIMFGVSAFSSARLIACAALFNKEPKYVYACWGGDFLLFLASIQIVQGDLRTWHMLSGTSHYFGPTTIRLVEWLTTTSAPQILFRNPCSVGGRLFTFWVGYSWLLNFGIIFFAAPSAEESFYGWETYTLPIFLGANLILLLSLLLFVRLMKKEYLNTFTTTENPKTYMYNNYWLGGGNKTSLTRKGGSPNSNSPGSRTRRPTKMQRGGETGREEGEDKLIEQMRLNRLTIKELDTLNGLKCHALTISHHLLPPNKEIKEWMQDWSKWESLKPDWFKANREVLLENLNVTVLGRDWIIEHFWNSANDELQFVAATLQAEFRPEDEEIKEWAEDNYEMFLEHPPSWWDLRWQLTLIMGEEGLPDGWWDSKKEGMFG
ncbi:hypothetical protein TL16_g08564 [Triparma laevis f. inornata]|uniref:Uncharacterized protein n=1 Tax=Triparma laevis f. inornata TaxID=1714386 RepID=A0A9W7B3K5_9STRA|nr:hypothetical protein TL16_g08564 [Triparma laevis f. inornata]